MGNQQRQILDPHLQVLQLQPPIAVAVHLIEKRRPEGYVDGEWISVERREEFRLHRNLRISCRVPTRLLSVRVDTVRTLLPVHRKNLHSAEPPPVRLERGVGELVEFFIAFAASLRSSALHVSGNLALILSIMSSASIWPRRTGASSSA